MTEHGSTRRIGLMGCGTVADYGHIPAILETPGLTLHALYDPNPDALLRMKNKHKIARAFSNLDDFFSSGIEAVSITSPAPCHHTNVIDAARMNLPVICEKPLATSAAEASEMIDAMKKSGCSLFNAFCYRFSPVALTIKSLVAEKAIGETRSLRLIYNWHLHGKYTRDSEGNLTRQKRRENRMLEGGPMLDCGTHQIDLAMFWMNSNIMRFSGHGAWVDDYDAPDHMWLHMDHACGAHTVVEISYSYHHTAKNKRSDFIYELIGTQGVIRYDRELRTFWMENETGRHDLPFHPEKSFSGMYREWARALETGTSELLTRAEDGMQVIEIARKATENATRAHLGVRRSDG